MQEPPEPPDQDRRIGALHALNLLDTEPEERFDRITRLAQRVFGTSMSAFTLVDSDRQWFKSKVNMQSAEDPLETGFCPHAILVAETTVVPDAREDVRFHDNPLVSVDPGIRFYAGHPVSGPGGEVLGTLCVIDDKPRLAADFDAEALAEFAAMVEAEVASLSLAIGDELTGLSNRRGFEMLGERLLRASRRLGLPLSIVYADLDNMKPINDTYGHDAGDQALIEIADVLSSTLRASDLVARLGGDEFCALLVGNAAEAATRSHSSTDSSRGLSVMPRLRESFHGCSVSALRSASLPSTRATRLGAASAALPTSRAQNSSPPRRATRSEARRVELRTSAISISAWSPASWP
jgi:diguanylate cyclase (GGDEF)-like protein